MNKYADCRIVGLSSLEHPLGPVTFDQLSECFQKYGYPQIIHFNRVFHYKPSNLGYPYFWKHPNKSFPTKSIGPKIGLEHPSTTNETQHLSTLPMKPLWNGEDLPTLSLARAGHQRWASQPFSRWEMGAERDAQVLNVVTSSLKS